MAHKKGAGSSDNGRDSISKRLGVKLFGGQVARAGNILVRQRGTKFHAGENVYMGKDHTLHAAIDGTVVFRKSVKDRKFVSVMPIVESCEEINAAEAKAMTQKAAAPAPEAKPAKAKAAPAPVVDAPVEVEAIAPVVEAAEAPAPKKAAKAASDKIAAGPFGNIKADDLKIVEGIGPKIEMLLHEGGIKTWEELANADVERLKEILDAAGPRYQIHNPGTWPAQSRFAADGKWDELKDYQDMLIGGKDANA